MKVPDWSNLAGNCDVTTQIGPNWPVNRDVTMLLISGYFWPSNWPVNRDIMIVNTLGRFNIFFLIFLTKTGTFD